VPRFQGIDLPIVPPPPVVSNSNPFDDFDDDDGFGDFGDFEKPPAPIQQPMQQPVQQQPVKQKM
jgi:hypothetical protein